MIAGLEVPHAHIHLIPMNSIGELSFTNPRPTFPADQMAEGFSTLATFTYATNNGYLDQKWRAMYDGVARANAVLRTLPTATDISPDNVKRITAEAKFLRAHFHFEAKRLFNNIVYSTDTTTATSNIDASGNFIDTWPAIEADLQAAIDGLPETQAQLGRVNKWAAKTYLARVTWSNINMPWQNRCWKKLSPVEKRLRETLCAG
jgi:hypothetical protein